MNTSSSVPSTRGVRFGASPKPRAILHAAIVLVLFSAGAAAAAEDDYTPQPEDALPKLVDITWSRGPDLPQGFQDSNGGIVDGTLVSACGFCQGRAEDNAKKPGLYPRGFLKKVWGVDLSHPETGWTDLPEFPGAARQGLLCAPAGNALYFWGGFSYSEPYCHADGFRLIRKGTDWAWEPLLTLPWPICGGMAVTLDTRIFLLGGADYDAEAFYTWNDRNGGCERLGARFLSLDTANAGAGWRRLPDCPGTPRWVACMSVARGKIYVIGGATGSEYSTVVDNWMFDPATETWTRLRDLPVASGNFPGGRLTFMDRYILLAGGYQYAKVADPDGSTRPPYGTPGRFNNQGEYYSDVFVYDVESGLFGRADSMPLNNNLSLTIVEGDEILMIGGETGTAQIDGVFYGHHPELFLRGRLRARPDATSGSKAADQD